MILIPNNIQAHFTTLVGSASDFHIQPTRVWEEQTISFLNTLSARLRRHPEANTLPDLMALAFWLRKANLLSMKTSPYSNRLSVGLGLTFHICPANVPINFAYSLAFALLAGNSCVLRLSSKSNRSTDIALQTLSKLLLESEYQPIAQRVFLIRYAHNDDVTAFWLSQAAGRVIWGGDHTINKMRQFATPPRSREIAFADRYSLCLLDATYISCCSDDLINTHCHHFYNDIYQLDQAGCSSPQLCVWLGDDSSVIEAKSRLWQCLADIAADKYAIEDIQVLNKFVDTCNAAIDHEDIANIEIASPELTRIEVKSINISQQSFRGTSGLIYETRIKSIAQLAPLINEKVQTLSYLGVEKSTIAEFIYSNGCSGIDRIVPIGNALNMHNLWDGYDIITTLSRIVTID
ncbi:acyl-CoA reductase [Pseudoalteromonas sp. A22]|uniref:acyl-CoA reductase n=1 Tax=Pseudoalteromonas TaxID=53246 RepID=UPI001BA5F7A8|nr:MULTISPECIES: acyl-CoA reductase [Pseudoalteromonas]QUI64254.1 acyl-CoA reductase [Pseudoalteromonas sp. A22]USE69963.1 acyl-CoA reductase [Pseudoalteromonas flavipulchra]